MNISYEEGRALALFVEFYGYPFKSGDIYDTQKLWAPHYIISEIGAGDFYGKEAMPNSLKPLLDALTLKNQGDIDEFYKKYLGKRDQIAEKVTNYNSLLKSMLIGYIFKDNIDRVAMAIDLFKPILKRHFSEFILPDFLYYIRHVYPTSDYYDALTSYCKTCRMYCLMIDDVMAKDIWNAMKALGLIKIPLEEHTIFVPEAFGKPKKFVPNENK